MEIMRHFDDRTKWESLLTVDDIPSIKCDESGGIENCINSSDLSIFSFCDNNYYFKENGRELGI
jgi:hypothetical protein